MEGSHPYADHSPSPVLEFLIVKLFCRVYCGISQHQGRERCTPPGIRCPEQPSMLPDWKKASADDMFFSIRLILTSYRTASTHTRAQCSRPIKTPCISTQSSNNAMPIPQHRDRTISRSGKSLITRPGPCRWGGRTVGCS